MSLTDIQNRFPWAFAINKLENFLVLGVIRNPEDWLISLYFLHKREPFRNHPTFTGDMDFSQFLFEWCSNFTWASEPQSSRLKLSDGKIGANLIIPLELLDKGFKFFTEKVGLAKVETPPIMNSSYRHSDVKLTIDKSIRDYIRTKYAEDFELWEQSLTLQQGVVN